MKLYEVSYWTEGPSHSETVLVAAKSKEQARRFMIKTQGVYRADQPGVTVRVSKKQGPQIVRYLE